MPAWSSRSNNYERSARGFLYCRPPYSGPCWVRQHMSSNLCWSWLAASSFFIWGGDACKWWEGKCLISLVSPRWKWDIERWGAICCHNQARHARGDIESCWCHRKAPPPKKVVKSRCFLYCFLLTVWSTEPQPLFLLSSLVFPSVAAAGVANAVAAAAAPVITIAIAAAISATIAVVVASAVAADVDIASAIAADVTATIALVVASAVAADVNIASAVAAAITATIAVVVATVVAAALAPCFLLLLLLFKTKSQGRYSGILSRTWFIDCIRSCDSPAHLFFAIQPLHQGISLFACQWFPHAMTMRKSLMFFFCKTKKQEKLAFPFQHSPSLPCWQIWIPPPPRLCPRSRRRNFMSGGGPFSFGGGRGSRKRISILSPPLSAGCAAGGNEIERGRKDSWERRRRGRV